MAQQMHADNPRSKRYMKKRAFLCVNKQEGLSRLVGVLSVSARVRRPLGKMERDQKRMLLHFSILSI